ncbi:MAG: aldo/keto reductase [Acidobacteriota bacterium]
MLESELRLNTGRTLPTIGFGTWQVDEAVAADIVVEAARCGYRHFDCACDYGNEAAVGAGLRKVIDEGICARDNLRITSKLWNTYHRREHVRRAVERSLRDLRLDYLDLYLIHFPIATKFVPFEDRYPPEWFYQPDAPSARMELDRVPISETWQAMEELVKAGLVRDIGVCNFGTSLLRDILTYAQIRPAVLQVELHPYLTQEKLLRFCRGAEIAVTAFSPLGALSYFSFEMAEKSESVIETKVIRDIARRHGRTPAQVVLRWGVQRGTAIIPKTLRPERLKENLAIFDFRLTDDESSAISGLNRNRRFNDPGDFCEAAFKTFLPIYE